MLYCTALYCTVLCRRVLYCAVLHCAVLCCTARSCLYCTACMYICIVLKIAVSLDIINIHWYSKIVSIISLSYLLKTDIRGLQYYDTSIVQNHMSYVHMSYIICFMNGATNINVFWKQKHRYVASFRLHKHWRWIPRVHCSKYKKSDASTTETQNK